MDGNWKIARQKCAFENSHVETVEFGKIPTGCILTPAYGSYFCDKHKDHQLSINYATGADRRCILKIKPQDIKLSNLSNLHV